MTSNKTLKRQYLETKARDGVYAIRNQITGRALVAGSTNVQGTLLDFCLALHRAHACMHANLSTLMSNAIAMICWVRGHLHGMVLHPWCCSKADQTKYRSAPKSRATQEHLRITHRAQD